MTQAIESNPTPTAANEGDDKGYADAKAEAVDAFHQVYLTRLLERCGGNISEAARRAGLDRSNFRRILKRYYKGYSGNTRKAAAKED